MRSAVIVLVIVAGMCFPSCKKEYICECTSPTETLTAFRAKDKKKNAEQRCETYYNQNYGSVAFNQTSCKIR